MTHRQPTPSGSKTPPFSRAAGLWLGLATLAALLLASCDRGPASAQPVRQAEEKTVELAPIVVQSAPRDVRIFGTLFGQEDLLISAKVPGRVSQIRADLGDAVQPGQPLAQIDPTDYALAVSEQRAALAAALAKVGLPDLPTGTVELAQLPEVARAQAEEANARSRLERARKLYERTPPLISEQDYADIQTQFQVATTTASVARLNAESQIAEARVRASALRSSEQRLTDTEIIAPRERPLTYRVAERRVSEGELVTQGQPLFRLVATERVKFRGRVPERYAGRVTPGADALVRVDAVQTPVRASVTRVSPAVDVESRAFEIEIEADNPEGTLKPGSFAHADISIGSEPDVRFVPAASVVSFAGITRVYSVREGKAVEHRVQLAPERQGLRELLPEANGRRPLAGVDAVVLSPGSLRAGQPVRVEPTAEATP